MLRESDGKGGTVKDKKLYTLGLLALIAFGGAVLEAALTGHVEPFGKFELVESLLSLVPLYWWYYLDKEQRKFSTGVVQNLAVVAVALIGLPVYFIRSRGWKKGGEPPPWPWGSGRCWSGWVGWENWWVRRWGVDRKIFRYWL